MNIIIRPFRPSDTLSIIQLFKEATQAINIRDYSPEQIAVWINISNPQWRKSLERNITLVAELHNIIIGFADMTHKGYLDHFYIHKDYLGAKGSWVAIKLMKAIEKVAYDHGITTITTDCSITAKKPAEFMGFLVTKKQIVIKNEVQFINYAMTKKLK